MKLKDPQVVEKSNELVKKLSTLSEDEIERQRTWLDQQQERFDKGVELAEHLSKVVNSMCSTDQQLGFLLAMKCEHRTLQQSVFQLFLTWCYFISQEYKDYDIDLRNDAMVKTAKKIVESLGKYGDALPFI